MVIEIIEICLMSEIVIEIYFVSIQRFAFYSFHLQLATHYLRCQRDPIASNAVTLILEYLHTCPRLNCVVCELPARQ